MDIFNSSLEISHVPSFFEKAGLYPILKPDCEEFSNFRLTAKLKFLNVTHTIKLLNFGGH